MSEHQSHSEIEVSSERSFGFVFAAFFGIVAFWPLLSEGALRIWAIAVAAVFLVVALAVPKLLKPLNILWFKFGMLLGRIVTPIVMLLVFVVAVLPTGLIMRAFGKDPMSRKMEPASKSYWIGRAPRDPETNSMKNQF